MLTKAFFIGGYMNQELVKELFVYNNGALYWNAIILQKPQLYGVRSGTKNARGYRKITVRSKSYMEHRLIFLMFHGFLPDVIDHINGIKDDNRIENLRAATVQQNQYNANFKSTSKSKIKGVYWEQSTQKWVARIRIHGKVKTLGRFRDVNLADQCCRLAREQHHGEFACHGGR
jgi:hypothetical protein